MAKLSDVYGGPLDEGVSIFTHIAEGLTKNPSGLAVITMHQPADHLSALPRHTSAESNAVLAKNPSSHGCLAWTYQQLHEAALKLAIGLQQRGLQPGMRIATFIPNRVEYPLILWVCTLLRLTLCSLDPGSSSTPREAELESFLTRLKPDAIVVLDSSAAAQVDATISRSGISDPEVKIILEGESRASWGTILDIAGHVRPSESETQALISSALHDDPNRTCFIMFTSGTSSGRPKGCVRHVAGITHSLLVQHWGEEFHIHSRPVASTANFRIISPTLHLAAWKAGACAVMPDPNQGVQGVMQAIRDHGITFLLFIPALLHAFVAELQAMSDSLNVSAIEAVTLGGDMVTRDLMVKAARAFPQAQIAVAHGMTEGGGFFDWPFFGRSIDDIPYHRDISPLGKVAKGVHTRIRDPDTGRVTQRGEPGELIVQCESIVKHYLDHTNEDAFLRDEVGDGGKAWFRTGDLAVINDDGLVYILGRIKDVIKRAGIPITPAALENCIAGFTGSSAAVLAWVHAALGQVPFAVVEALHGKTAEEVKMQVVAMFGKDYALEGVVTLQELGLDSWPLNATGKIMKLDLLARVEEFLE
ncbi:4-coumarate--CoA ligase-like 2 [Cercospora zeina]